MRSQVAWAIGAILGFVVGACGGPEEEEGAPTTEVDQSLRVRFRQQAVGPAACGITTCVEGFHCRTTLVYGAPVKTCVPDSGQLPPCNCDPGFHCVRAPSGAQSCAPNTPPPPPATCGSISCAPGTHCVTFTVYGAPVPACVAN
jgi:hypothetical protein